jgi:non-specific serine/threonine protein kinase/serine/threonine-protein kinase
VKRALDYFDSLAAEEKDNIGLQRELADAYDKLGNVLGRPYAANVGNTGAALASYRKALEIRQRLATASPTERRSQLDLWSSYNNVGGLLRETADTPGALRMHQSGRQTVGDLLRNAPDDQVVRTAAQSASTLSLTYVQAGHLREAADAARETLSFDERLLSGDSTNPLLQNDVATAHGRLGQILMKLGDRSAAQSHFQQAFATAEALVNAQPSNIAFRRRLSSTHSHLAQLLVRQGDVDAAWPHQQMALALRQRLVDSNPEDRQASIDLMIAHLETGEVLARRRDFTAAAVHYRLALTRGEPMAAADPSYVYYRLSVATTLIRLAQALAGGADSDEAARLAERAIDLTESASAQDPADVRLRFELALAYAMMGDLSRSRSSPRIVLTGGDQEASPRTWYQRSLEVLNELRESGRRAGGPLDDDEPELIASIEQKLSAVR